MNKGLVFGKFYPLHAGHIAMIEYAKNYCDHLVVLICCSDKELIDSTTREKWLLDELGDTQGIEIRVFTYRETDLPNTSASSRSVSRIWSDVFNQLVPDVSMIVTSEPYGEYVAEYMNISHIPYDVERKNHPISASTLRSDIIKSWKFLPNSVKSYFQRKIIIDGTESTGKSTLAAYLASYFRGAHVEEAGRNLIPNSSNFTPADLYITAETHANNIKSAIDTLSPVVVIDTDVFVTQSYSQFRFGKKLELEAWVYDQSQADLHLYLSADVPHIQDGTRMIKEERNKLDESHKNILKQNNIDYLEISGAWDSRQQQALEIAISKVYPVWYNS